MSETVEKKQVCRCENCGNEAEMTFVCMLPDANENTEPDVDKEKPAGQKDSLRKVKGTATCTSCGNEADMWIDL